MDPKQTPGMEPEESRGYRRDEEDLYARARQTEDLEGQLGPDELPDPDEVAMNLEAKRHP